MAQSIRDQMVDKGLTSGSHPPTTVRRCADCGATLPSENRRGLRCAECAADGV